MKKLILPFLLLMSLGASAQWTTGGTVQGQFTGNGRIRWGFGTSGYILGYTKAQIDSLFGTVAGLTFTNPLLKTGTVVSLLTDVTPTASGIKPLTSGGAFTALAGKQNTITTGTISQYFRGDLSLATFPTIYSFSGNTSQYTRGDGTYATLNTTVVPEGTNLYWTPTRFNTAFSGKTSDDLTEGSTNLYYTAARSALKADKTTTISASGNGIMGGGSLAANRSVSLDFNYLDARYAVTGTTLYPLTFNNGGAGDASGVAFSGNVARTISYNTIGAIGGSGTANQVARFTGANTQNGGSINDTGTSGGGNLNVSNSLVAVSPALQLNTVSTGTLGTNPILIWDIDGAGTGVVKQVPNRTFLTPSGDGSGLTGIARRLGKVVNSTMNTSSVANYTQVHPNTTYTFGSSYVTSAGGSGGIDNYMYYTGYISNSTYFSMRDTVVGVSDGGGIGLGVDGTLSTLGYIIMTGADKGKVAIRTNSTIRATSTNALSYTNLTDSIELTFTRSLWTFIMTARVINNPSQVVTTTFLWPYVDGVGGNSPIGNTFHATVYSLGGTQRITGHHEYNVYETTSLQGLIYSHSLYAANADTVSWTYRAQSRFSGGVNIIAGSGTRVTDYVKLKPEIFSLSPKYMIFFNGINDIIDGVPVATIYSAITSWANDCFARNITPVLLNCAPVTAAITGVGQTNAQLRARIDSLNTLIAANTSIPIKVDVYTPLVLAGVLNAEYASSSNGIHWSRAGHDVVYLAVENAMKSFISMTGIMTPVRFGGTGTNLTATGGAANYLKQSTLGGNVTVGTIPYTDITGTPSPLSGTGLLSYSGSTPSYNTTSASIASIISDETGSGAMVFGTSPTLITPTLVTPNLGTPTSGAITNLSGTCASCSIGGNAATVTTNANLTGPVTSVGNATSLGANIGLAGITPSTFAANEKSIEIALGNSIYSNSSTKTFFMAQNIANSLKVYNGASGSFSNSNGVFAFSTSLYGAAGAASGVIARFRIDSLGVRVFNVTGSRAVTFGSTGILTASATTDTELGYVSGVTSAIQTQLNTKAALASPALTGNPTAPTQSANDNSTKVATTAYVDAGDALKLTNPMTTLGDIIYSSSGSTAARLGIGGANTVLHGGTIPSYSAIVQGDVTNGFVDLTSTQSVGGNKTFTGANIYNNGQTFNNGIISNANVVMGNTKTVNYQNGAGTLFTSIGAINPTTTNTINYPDASGTVDLGFKLRLTGSGTGAATTISIAHGLSGVTSASIALVQPINAASAGVSYVTTDATNINIVYTVAPILGTSNLSYNVSIKP